MSNPQPSSRIAHNPTFKHSLNEILRMRELGLKSYIGCDDDIYAKLYNKIDCYSLEGKHNPGNKGGGIFNLEFSLDGKLLVAACEHSCVLIYDASTQRLIKTMEKAHDNCVNCVRFLDDRQFATCSDDNTIKLWDTRNLKNETKTLHGHSNWVKNIEFSERDNVMVTSAFDGSIYAWDLKSPTENSMLYDKVFLMNGLMRTKLSPDGSKMVISTTSGYMIIVHDLNLATLANDFRSFKPVLYRLMQMSGQSFPAGTIFNYLFLPSRRRNRVEFIDDFTIDAEVISSLQIHPHGWNAVSRSLSGNESEEATCVHDIQKREVFMFQYESCDNYDLDEGEASQNSDSDEGTANPRPTDLWMGYISNYQYTSDRQAQPNMFENLQLPSMGIINSGLIGRNSYSDYFQQHPEERNKVIVNLPRLTHYIKEENVGRGYIKELCYSPDGRVICSPYNKGIRLLGFSEKYEELSYCVPEKPRQLTTLLELNDYHSQIVVSCKFNPRNFMLVSGCLNGEIVWYKPVL
ncbi:DDB1- and CUL4-associated factor 10 homolog [Tribolium madens]|uniref:DDB1- and CUL4-associated factor 10 homolog n=1 Tax=Tribolium madens TaxID=41895 RepID=UPI001CF73AFB|nr:DDB1- and CUL4-associated factor 10 homolog [Tribolium madens]